MQRPDICREANLKLNKDKYLFRGTSIPFFGEIMSWNDVSLDLTKVQVLKNMLPPKCKKVLQSFLDILNYLNKFPPVTAEVCGPLRNSHQ